MKNQEPLKAIKFDSFRSRVERLHWF